MITKLKSINNLAVFQNFNWDTNIRDEGNNVVLFKPINIIYGRNYSGKTTLSRIIRALEVGNISEKYENPQFEIGIKDKEIANQNNLSAHGKKIRVFNEDFVKDNLQFIIDSDSSITPFAIIGGNASIETEINRLKDDLGNNEEESESGFYLELKNATSTANIAFETYKDEKNQLDQKLTTKALDRTTGIKYRSNRFGDQNYTKAKLSSDIKTVLENSFQPLTDNAVKLKTNLLEERANPDISGITKPNLDLTSINTKAKNLITKSISSSNKIEKL